MGGGEFPIGIPDERLPFVRSRMKYDPNFPNLEGEEEFYYIDTGEVIPADDEAEDESEKE